MGNEIPNMFDMIERGKVKRWGTPGLDQLGATAPREHRKLSQPVRPVKHMSRREVNELKSKIKERLDEEAVHDELLKGMM